MLYDEVDNPVLSSPPTVRSDSNSPEQRENEFEAHSLFEEPSTTKTIVISLSLADSRTHSITSSPDPRTKEPELFYTTRMNLVFENNTRVRYILPNFC
jgi:hypothetical protein